jgi:hypothetical protein
MSARCCVAEERTLGSGPLFRSRLVRRVIGAVRWLLVGAAVVVVPKCPMCLAAWIALGTGVGISVTTAAYLRVGLAVMCAVSLVYMVAKRVRVRASGG